MEAMWKELYAGLRDFLTGERALEALRFAIFLLVGLLVAKLVSRGVARAVRLRLEPQQTTLLRRALYYGILGLFVASGLHHLGFNLGVLLGAAGVFTVAIGFASQTSASNLISGLFLIAERPFSVGDVITVGGTTGEVLSIDLLSVKLRTFDNLFVRLPNEQMIKSEVTTLTRFPIRRVDLVVGVAYKEDLDHVEQILRQVATDNPLSLAEPAPLFMITGFGDSSIDLQFSVWGQRDNFLALRTGIYRAIKQAFDAEGIEIPFPHRSLYAGEATRPLPVQVEGKVGVAGEGGDTD